MVELVSVGTLVHVEVWHPLRSWIRHPSVPALLPHVGFAAHLVVHNPPPSHSDAQSIVRHRWIWRGEGTWAVSDAGSGAVLLAGIERPLLAIAIAAELSGFALFPADDVRRLWRALDVARGMRTCLEGNPFEAWLDGAAAGFDREPGGPTELLEAGAL